MNSRGGSKGSSRERSSNRRRSIRKHFICKKSITGLPTVGLTASKFPMRIFCASFKQFFFVVVGEAGVRVVFVETELRVLA